MGFCKTAFIIHVYTVLPLVALSLCGVLKFPTMGNSSCACESENGIHCFIITNLCLNSDLEVISNHARLKYNSTQTIYSLGTSDAVNLTHGVPDTEQNPRLYVPLQFVWYMLLHLALIFLEMWCFRPFCTISHFAKYVEEVLLSKTLNAGDKMKVIKRISMRKIMVMAGQRLFARSFFGFVFVCIQLLLVSLQVDDLGGRQLRSWLFGCLESNDFLYTGFPEIANCRLNGTTFIHNINMGYLAESSEVITTCKLYSSGLTRIIFTCFYLWSNIFALVLAHWMLTNVRILGSPPRMQEIMLQSWSRSGFSFV